MRAVRIEFVPTSAWLAVWFTAFVVLSILVGWSLGRHRSATMKLDATHNKIAALRIEARSLRAVTAKAAEAPPDPEQRAAESIVSVTRRDWNGVFATVENLQEPGIRLTALTIDGGEVRLDYEIDSLAQAAVVTRQLNAGTERSRWKFLGANVSLSRSASATLQGPGKLNAHWSGALADVQ